MVVTECDVIITHHNGRIAEIADLLIINVLGSDVKRMSLSILLKRINVVILCKGLTCFDLPTLVCPRRLTIMGISVLCLGVMTDMR